MKKQLLVCLLAASPLLCAQDVAVLKINLAKKQPPAEVAFDLFAADAPMTVENFKKLARKHFYDGLTFHRAFPHILVQVGDPLSRKKDRSKVGTGGPGWTVPPEIHRRHVKGAVAMARLPDKINPSRVSNGSQFFICLQAMPSYDGQYTVFGQVTRGMETLDAISTKTVDSNDNPVDRIVIKSLRVVPREKLPAPATPKPAGARPAKKPWWKLWG